MGSLSMLGNQGRLLAALVTEPDADVRLLARRTGATLRSTRQLLRDLQAAGFITDVADATPSGFVVEPDATTVVMGMAFDAEDIRDIASNGINGLLAVLRTSEAREAAALDHRRLRSPETHPDVPDD